MRLVIGLGNPGPRFEGTRHNVGFDVVRRVARLRGIQLRKRFLRPVLWGGAGDLVLALPLTYMNRSGSILPDLMRRAGAAAEDVLVVCDNMDLPPGAVRIRRRGSSRAHNGIASVMDALGTGEFARLYLGVGRPSDPSAVVDHVLARPPEAEMPAYRAAVEAGAQAVVALAQEPFETVSNRVNARREP